MNKRRLGLVLATVLGINTLMIVTTGYTNGQVQVANALVGDQVKLLEGIAIRHLKTTVDSETDGKTSLSFELIYGDNKITLNKKNVSNIRVSKSFTHKIFKGREGIDKQVSDIYSGTWNPETGKFVLNNKLTEPGIYTGEIEVEFKDGTAEKYAVSLRKMQNDMLNYKLKVEVGKIKVVDLKLNNGNRETDYKIDPKNVTLVNLDNNKVANVREIKGNEIIFDAIDLSTNGNLKLNDRLQLKVKYGKNNEKEVVSDILLVKQEVPKIQEVYVSNTKQGINGQKTIDKNLQESFKKNYTASTVGNITVPEVKDGLNTVKIGDENLLEYKQTTVTGANQTYYGGAPIQTKIDGTNVDLIFGGSLNLGRKKKGPGISGGINQSDNFIPFATVFYGRDESQPKKDKKNKVGFIGDYTFTIDGQTVTYFDALKGLTPKLDGKGNQNGVQNDPHYLKFVDFDGSKSYLRNFYGVAQNGVPSTLGDTSVSLMTDRKTVKLELGDKLQHGYTSITGTFAVDFSEDERVIQNINNTMTTEPQGKPQRLTAEINNNTLYHPDEEVKPVDVSVIIVSDVLDGAYANAKFERTSASTGKLTLMGAKSILSGKDLSNARLTVDNAETGLLVSESTGDKLVFGVSFNGKVPETMNWELRVHDGDAKLDGKFNTGVVEAINLREVKASNEGTTAIADQFEVKAQFDLNDKGNFKLDSRTSNRLGIKDFTIGQHTIKFEVTEGDNQGVYEAGINVSKGNFKLDVKNVSASTNAVNLTITSTNLTKDAVEKVNEAMIEYRESSEKGTNPWVKSNVSFVLTGNNKELKDKVAVTKVVTGLGAGKKYDFKVTFRVKNGNKVEEEVSTTIMNVQLAGNSVVGGSGTVIGGSDVRPTGTTTVVSSSLNTTGNAYTTNIMVPTTVKVDINRPIMIDKVTYKDKKGTTVRENTAEYINVIARFNNGKVILEGLVPGKQYDEINLRYTDDKGKENILIIRNANTVARTGSIEEYLANVYVVSLGRPADESGYYYHLNNLIGRKTTLSTFLLNMLSEREFTSLYKTPEAKIEALYSAIVAREADAQGKQFWTNEYKKMLSVYGTEEKTLKAIAERMVNEREVKDLAGRLGILL